jgi:hypothetical protein
MPRKPKPKCPHCGSTKTTPIVYGYPTEEAFAAEAKGRIHLGGCVLSGGDPDRVCDACGTAFVSGS